MGQGRPHHVPILTRLQSEKGGGLLTAVADPLNPQKVGVVGDRGVLVDVEDLLVPAHAVQFLLQQPDPLVEGSLPGQAGGGGEGEGGGLERPLSLGELLQLLEDARSARGEVLHWQTRHVFLVSGL